MKQKSNPRWIKKGRQRKGLSFWCTACGKISYCISYAKDDLGQPVNRCDYEYCPHCGVRITGGEA